MKISSTKFNLALAYHCMGIADLAKMSGVSKVRLSDIKNGKAEVVRPGTIGKIAKALDVPVTDIIEMEDL